MQQLISTHSHIHIYNCLYDIPMTSASIGRRCRFLPLSISLVPFFCCRDTWTKRWTLDEITSNFITVSQFDHRWSRTILPCALFTSSNVSRISFSYFEQKENPNKPRFQFLYHAYAQLVWKSMDSHKYMLMYLWI